MKLPGNQADARGLYQINPLFQFQQNKPVVELTRHDAWSFASVIAKTSDQKFDGVAAFIPNKSTMLWFSFAAACSVHALA